MNRVSIWKRLRTWCRVTMLRRRFESDVNDEILFHLDEHARALVAKGVPEGEAKRQARIAFGGAETTRDGVRSALGLRPWDTLLADVRYGARVLRKSPGFTAVAAGSLALAIGANTTIFSVAHFVLLQRLAVPHARDLRMLFHDDGERSVFQMTWGSSYKVDNGLFRSDAFTYPIFRQMQQDMRGRGVEVFAFKDTGVNAAGAGPAQAVRAEMVSGNFYAQMQTVPVLGRGILPSDDGAPGTGAVAVISHAYWQRAFGGAPDVVGRVLHLQGAPVTIVGVNPPGFTGAQDAQRSPELFLPLSMMGQLHATLGPEVVLHSAKLSWVQLMVRKPAELTDAALQSDLRHAFHTATVATLPPKAGEDVPELALEDGSRGLAESSRMLRQPIQVLLGMVACVLLLACANVANLMLARASNRQREISVRLALGAGRARVFRQLLVESLLLAMLGGSAGAVLGYFGRLASPVFLQSAWDSAATPIPFRWPVFLFTLGITVSTGILFGLAPAWQSTRAEVNTALKQGARSASRRRGAWAGKGLVALQIALATLLVGGSALCVRTLSKLSAVPPGFDPEGLLLFEVQPSDQQYPGARSVALHTALLDRVAAVPGVEAASAASIPLIARSMWTSRVRMEDAPEHAKVPGGVNRNSIMPNWFQVMHIPVTQGRGFLSQDTSTSPRVVVVNRAFAQRYFPDRNPLGRRISVDSKEESGKQVPEWLTIVGICANTQYSDLRTEVGPIVFTNFLQTEEDTNMNAESLTYTVRSTLPPAVLLPMLQQAAAQVDPNLPLSEARTQVQQIAEVSRQERLFARLTAGFGLLAVTLAIVGIYGLMAYTVAQRTHEIGIRLALGAERARVRAMVLREATWLALAGVLVGSVAVLLIGRVLKSMLYRLNPDDPLSLGLSVALLLLVALSASWLPAARAARLEPVIALRQD